MNYLYKYQTISKNTLEIFINRTLFFARSKQFNDPFDGQLLPKDFVNELEDLGYESDESKILQHEQYVSDRINGYGIYCASRKCNDILMWSHYADAHRGICIGFKDDLTRYFEEYDWPIWQESIKYENSHPFRSIHDDLISKKRFDSSDGFLNLCELGNALLSAAITVKHSSWAYEEEERIFSEVPGPLIFQAKALDHIILGMNISKEDEYTVRSLCDTEIWQHVRLYKAQRSRAALSLEIMELGLP